MKYILLWLFIVMLSSCSPSDDTKWFRGNTKTIPISTIYLEYWIKGVYKVVDWDVVCYIVDDWISCIK